MGTRSSSALAAFKDGLETERADYAWSARGDLERELHPLEPVRVTLSPESVEQRVLGPGQTAGMRSGRVVLAAGTAMHRHSTKQNEEVLVMLSGTVRVVLGDAPMELAAGQVLYIPSNTDHEVHNDGSVEARYLYLVAPAR